MNTYFDFNYRLRTKRGFTLLELILVLFVLGMMAAALAPTMRGVIERAREDAETKSLDSLAEAIRGSFESPDLTNLNVAALPGTIGPGDSPTVFSTATGGAYATTEAGSWFTKVARNRGVTPHVGQPLSTAAQPELARIAYNPLGNPRLLFAAPDEPGRQRFLLVSLMARPEHLVMPAYEAGRDWFDAIADHAWENPTAGIPALWAARLTAAQRAGWLDGPGGTTQAHRLLVRTISLPKYTLTLNNNHPTEHQFASFNNVGPALTAAANSGANVTPEILGGRLVIISHGAAFPGVETHRLHLHSNDAVTLQ